MNDNTKNGLLATMRNSAKNTYNKTAAVVAGAAIAASPMLALAGGGGDFDAAPIIAKLVTYTAIGVTILAAFALGRWTLKALGLIGGK